jgi:hypothetical protein
MALSITLTEVRMEELFGKTTETRILDLILPLNEGTEFTEKQVIHALGPKEKPTEIKPVIRAMVDEGILVKTGKPGTYTVNHKSKRVWAVRNLLIAIYCDLANNVSRQRLGIEHDNHPVKTT